MEQEHRVFCDSCKTWHPIDDCCMCDAVPEYEHPEPDGSPD